MSLWIKLDANLPDHPKIVHLREMAGTKADSAELGWYRLLMAAKRYGRWSFASESHLRHVMGRYYGFVGLYKLVGLLDGDGLTIHDGDEYNAPRSPTERKRDQRERDRMSRDPRDTPSQNVTPRAEQSRAEENRAEDEARDPADAYWQLTGRYPTDKLIAWIDDLTSKYGAEAVVRSLVDEFRADAKTATLMGRVGDRCRRGARELDRRERETEQARLAEKRSRPRVLEPWQEAFRAAIEEQYRGDAA